MKKHGSRIETRRNSMPPAGDDLVRAVVHDLECYGLSDTTADSDPAPDGFVARSLVKDSDVGGTDRSERMLFAVACDTRPNAVDSAAADDALRRLELAARRCLDGERSDHDERVLASAFEGIDPGIALAAAIVRWPHVALAARGDCAAFRVDQDRVERVSASGDSSRQSGTRSPDETETNVMELAVGDHIALCSPGIFRYVSDMRLHAHVASDLPTEEVCQCLLAAARGAGSDESATVVVAHFDPPKKRSKMPATELPDDSRRTLGIMPGPAEAPRIHRRDRAGHVAIVSC